MMQLKNNVTGGFSMLAPGSMTPLAEVSSAYAVCDSAGYDHNGSRMEVHVCDARMVIESDLPLSGIAQRRARRDTVLFRGRIYEMPGGAKISGHRDDALVFKAR